MDFKFQALTKVSTTPIASLSSIRSVRREFLGYGHNLRPPSALRLGRKCSKLGLRNRSRRFYLKASLESDSVVVVVAVTAFTAFSIAWLNHYFKIRNSAEVPDSSKLALSQLEKDTIDFIIGNEILDYEGLHGGSLTRGSESSVDKIRDNSHGHEDKNARMQFHETPLMHDGCLLVKVADVPGADFLASRAGKYALLEESKAADLSTTPLLIPESDVLQPLLHAARMTELQLENDMKETVFVSEVVPRAPMEFESVGALSSANNSVAVTNIDEKLHHKLGEEGEINGYPSISIESVRDELYTFYRSNQSAEQSRSILNGLKPESSRAFSLSQNRFSSLARELALKHEEFSAQDSLQAAEHFEGKIPVACYRGSSSGTSKTLGRGTGVPRYNERKPPAKDNHTVLPKFPYPNGTDALDKHHSAEQFSAYSRLLRDGRLTDCMDLLEDMEKRGLLDTNKIYHAKFYKICKNRKAVKEAFRFTKLVPNPTLSTFNMLMSVCASSRDPEGAFQVMQLVQEAGMKADCKLYTTLISTCAKSGKVDAMFEVFHEMVNARVEPNVHTYGALIDGCAKAGQVAKAFGAYGIMRSKNVKPDRVVFNALITACGQSGAVDRAFDVLAEMRTEIQPVDPDHVTIGALMMACANAGQVDRAQEVYKMIHDYNITGTPEVYTIAVNCCSQTGDWKFACNVYGDMKNKGIVPDEMFLSALIDVAGHAGKLDAAFEILQEARIQGIRLGTVSYSSLMGACSNAKNWQKALQLFEDIKSINLNPTVSTLNALITALCDGDQLPKAMEVLSEMKSLGPCPNNITYSVLSVASERKDDLEAALMLLSQAKMDGISPSLVICRSIIGMCLQRFEKACNLGETVLSFKSGHPHIENEWTLQALMVYRDTIVGGVVPNMEIVSQALGCLQLPFNSSVKERLIEDLGVTADSSRYSNLCALIDGFGEYDPRAFSLLEEAASLGIVPFVSFKDSPIVVDARKLQIHTAEVYFLTILKGLKHRLAAGAKLPNITILLLVEKVQITSPKGEKTINLAGRIGQAVAALLRRLRLPYQGNESYGKIRINGLVLRRWFQPKLASPFRIKRGELSLSQLELGKEIIHQQRNIRTGNLSAIERI
ncbi:putative Pentatricopeptide repeat-containing protein [Tripterygium wilfordii]|uniref:Putative Pentatricopeptide repeat-containing protein n=1 Tax=Tripterygium wilfordii TaxID=458696 RepID=A0A7J7C149_TRIWF|nr:pentatricopeptide repeat-containing protein MRL1, chloroplastic [Tripterygium wilfordii]KAF5727843.1 putative Pentatricopeptide repeat-containing protein [Tripterygium wilfordii]